MDWVFREYSNPFSFIDVLIENNRLCEWILKFAETHKRKLQWEAWLHKDFENSFESYVQPTTTTTNEVIKKDEMISIVKESANILKNFKIEGGQ